MSAPRLVAAAGRRHAAEADAGRRGTRRAARCSAAPIRPGMRAQNERLVLSLVRRHGALAKSEIARMTGLSAQTVSVIMRHLEADRLLKRGEPQRGRVGPAARCRCRSTRRARSSSAPRSGGAASTSCWSTSSAASAAASARPTPSRPRATTVARILRGVRGCEAVLGERAGAHRRARARHALRALELGRGDRRAGGGDGGLAARRHPRRARRRALPYPVYLQNDATAACGAELAFGEHARPAGLRLLLRRRLRRRRAGAERRALRRAHRQRRGARLDAGAGRRGRHGAADRPRLAGAARAPAARRRAAARRALRPRRRLGRLRRAPRRLARRPRRAASPTPSPRPRRSSTSRPR